MSVANPPNASVIEDLGHVSNPSKQCNVASATNADLTDSAHLGAPSVGIFVGGAGNITLTDCRGVNATYAVLAGRFLSGVFVGVVGATTTATGIIAFGK